MTIVQLSEENPNARDNQQRFRKRPEKSRFSQTFSQFTAVMEEVCWLRNLIHKVGFLSHKRRSGVEWRGKWLSWSSSSWPSSRWPSSRRVQPSNWSPVVSVSFHPTTLFLSCHKDYQHDLSLNRGPQDNEKNIDDEGDAKEVAMLGKTT